MAAEEVDGVASSHGGTRLPGDSSPTVGEFVDNITGGASRTRGLSVDVGEQQAAADITVNVEYGRSIPKVTQAVRERVIKRVENLTGLEVTEVNIQVNDVILPEELAQHAPAFRPPLVSISARRLRRLVSTVSSSLSSSQHFSQVEPDQARETQGLLSRDRARPRTT